MNLDKLKKKYRKKKDKLKKMAKVRPNSLSSELSMNSSRLFNAGINKTNADFLMGKAKSSLKATKARVKLKWSRKKEDGKKLTIPQVEAKVDCDKEVIAAENQYLETKYVFDMCETAVFAIKEKGNQLTNLAHNKRAEMNYNYVREAKEDRLKTKIGNTKKRRV